MQDSFDVHGSADPDRAPLLDFERLDVYRVALEFQALTASIALPQGRRELRDQLERAAAACSFASSRCTPACAFA